MTSASGSGLQAALIGLAIRFRGIVLALACVLVAYGLYGLGRARYDVFPEFAPPQVSIQTESAGLAPEQVETLVTRPIEAAIGGLPGVARVQSASIQGLSVVTAFFDPTGDVYRDRQSVGEQLAVAARQLPAGVQAPTMTPLASSTGLVLVAGLSSSERLPTQLASMRLRSVADWTLRPRLLAVPGVAEVDVFGGDVRSLQVQVHPDQLIRFGLDLNEVLAAARSATGLRGAGFVDTPNQRIVLQSEGQSLTPHGLARTVIVQHGAAVVTLGDVASVVEAAAPAVGGGAIEGRPGVVLDISAQYGADTVTVTQAVEAVLRGMRPQLRGQGIDLHAGLFRPANFIGAAIGNLRGSLLLGGALVIAVLLLFLFDLRVAAIACTAIPLSLLAATLVLQRLGVTLNTMTLGGLAIAIGEVVDDAVIGVENVARRLRERPSSPYARVILEACLEVRGAVVYATFAVILVFLPVLALSGIAGRLFAPLGLAYILAVLASLLVALTVVPALGMALLAGRGQRAPPFLLAWLRAHYARLLQRIARRPGVVMAAAAAFTIAGCAALPLFGGGFIPELREGHFIVHMVAVPGTSIDQSLRIGARVTSALQRLPQVRSVAQRVGRAALANDTYGPHDSEFEVELKPLGGNAAEQAQAALRGALSGIVGVSFTVNSFLTERIEETLSGNPAPVAIDIAGDDLDALDGEAQEIARLLARVPGASEIRVQSPPGMPQLSIRLRQPDLERWGLDAVAVLDLVHTAYQGDVVGQAYQGAAVFDVITLLDPASRVVTAIGGLPLRTPQGTYVMLRQVADIYEGTSRYQVRHLGGQRVQTVTANVTGRALTGFVRDARAAVARVRLPFGTSIAFTGTAEAQSQSQRDLVLNGLLAGVGIVLLVSVVARGWRNLVLVLVNLPFALAGGVLAVFVTGGIVSLGSMVGFVTLFGITLRNSIMMVSHYRHLVEVDGLRWGPQAAVAGAADRLVPILMTSLVTALGLLPLAIGMGDPGREVEGPMAVVILGGLLTSMALNLLVLPTLALRFGRFEPASDEFAVGLA